MDDRERNTGALLLSCPRTPDCEDQNQGCHSVAEICSAAAFSRFFPWAAYSAGTSCRDLGLSQRWVRMGPCASIDIFVLVGDENTKFDALTLR